MIATIKRDILSRSAPYSAQTVVSYSTNSVIIMKFMDLVEDCSSPYGSENEVDEKPNSPIE